MKAKAKYYFGTFLTGLTISKCDFSTFEKWYNEEHTDIATREIYSVACYVWDNFKKR